MQGIVPNGKVPDAVQLSVLCVGQGMKHTENLPDAGFALL